MAGIKETGELVVWVGKMGSAVGSSLADGKLNAGDAWTLIGALPGLPAALIGIDQVPAELKDLDAEEAGELVRMFAEAFEIPSHEAEVKVEMVLQAIVQFYKMIMGMKGL